MTGAAWGGSPVPVLRGLEAVEPRARIDASPFAGLLIVLLITYMVLTPPPMHGHGLPRARTAEPFEAGLPVLGIDRLGSYFVEDRPVPDAELADALDAAIEGSRADVVVVKASDEVDYARVEAALRSLRDAGVRRVVLEAYPPRRPARTH